MADSSLFTREGKYLMLALDHRGSIKKLINPTMPDSVPEEEVVNLKHEIINSLKDQFSGLLIDETYGLEAYPKHTKPFLLPVEKSGYTDKLGERLTELEYSVKQLKGYGASGAKILLYFNPNVPSVNQQLVTAKQVLLECQQANFPYFLEIRVYDPQTGDEIEERVEELVLGSLKMLIEGGVVPDVWKLEYPGSLEGCQRVTKLVGATPWILLTKGSTFNKFTEELQEAVQAGCVGFLAGRALWQDIGQLQGVERERFLKEDLPERFKQISGIVASR